MALLLAGLTSPPPLTVAVFVSVVGPTTDVATVALICMVGKLCLAATVVLRLHVTTWPATVHVQPGADATAIDVSPGSSVMVAVTWPAVEANALALVTVAKTLTGPPIETVVSECVSEIVGSGVHSAPEPAPGISAGEAVSVWPSSPCSAPNVSLAVVVIPGWPPFTWRTGLPAATVKAITPPPPPPPGPWRLPRVAPPGSWSRHESPPRPPFARRVRLAMLVVASVTVRTMLPPAPPPPPPSLRVSLNAAAPFALTIAPAATESVPARIAMRPPPAAPLLACAS